MASKPQSPLAMVLVLTLIAGISGLALAGMSEITREPIRIARQADLKASLRKILPPYANEPSEDRERCQPQQGCTKLAADDQSATPAEALDLYIARDGAGKAVGAAFQVSSNQGYGGEIRVLLGVDAQQQISGYYVLEHKETPGLGDKASKDDPDSQEDFADQFRGHGLANFNFAVKKDGGQVDAITSATITSRAVSGAFKAGLERYRSLRAEGSR